MFGIGVGWLLHLVADGMWAAPETFLWPAFGTEFSTSPTEPYTWDLFLDPIAHLSTWGGELIGFAILGVVLGGLPARRSRSVSAFSFGWLSQALT